MYCWHFCSKHFITWMGSRSPRCAYLPFTLFSLYNGIVYFLFNSLLGIEAATAAILNLQPSGNHRNQYTLYSTFFPSFESLKYIAHAGIKEVVYCEKYDSDESTLDPILEEYDIKCR